MKLCRLLYGMYRQAHMYREVEYTGENNWIIRTNSLESSVHEQFCTFRADAIETKEYLVHHPKRTSSL